MTPCAILFYFLRRKVMKSFESLNNTNLKEKEELQAKKWKEEGLLL